MFLENMCKNKYLCSKNCGHCGSLWKLPNYFPTEYQSLMHSSFHSARGKVGHNANILLLCILSASSGKPMLQILTEDSTKAYSVIDWLSHAR